MRFNVISSGSSGNCTIVYSHNKAILLDFGISKKRVTTALKEFNLSFDDLEAFFITHTHSDHASDAFNAPLDKLYIPQPKVPKVDTIISNDHLIKPYQTIYTDTFKVTSFPVSHDVKNTMGYLIEDNEESLVYLTDTGYVPEKDYPYIKNKTYYIFESNHDAKMLYESKRPMYLIKRIISDTGHLSNYDSAYYLSILIGDNTKEVVLSHLSNECNTEELALTAFNTVMMSQLGKIPNVKVCCASDKKETLGGKDED